MNVLILGGMSSRHKEWVRDVAAALRPRFDEVRLLDYLHWGDPEGVMDVPAELDRAVHLAENFGEYVVVAKSIGTVVTTLANARGLLLPRRCVFMGFPLSVVLSEFPDVADVLSKLPPSVFIHNEHDPLGPAEAVKAFVNVHAPQIYEFRVLPGDTHEYVDFDLIRDLAAAKI